MAAGQASLWGLVRAQRPKWAYTPGACGCINRLRWNLGPIKGSKRGLAAWQCRQRSARSQGPTAPARAHTHSLVVAGTGTASQASSTSKDASRFGAVGGQEKMTPPAAWLWSLLALRDVDTRHAYIKRLQSQVSLAVTDSLSGRYVLLTLLELYTQSTLSAVRLVAGLSTGSQPRISYNSTSCSERGSTTRRRTKSKT